MKKKIDPILTRLFGTALDYRTKYRVAAAITLLSIRDYQYVIHNN